MRIYSIKPKFQKFLSPIKNLFIKYNVHPTIINILALLFSILGGFLIYYSSFNIWLLIYIPFIAFIRTALNALDGLVARELKVKNQEYGEVLNEFIDRLSDVAFFFGIILATYTNILLGSITLVVVLLSSYLGIVSKAAGGKRQYIGLMGKADRMFYLSVAAVLILILKNLEIMNWFLIFVLVLGVITIFQRFFTIKKELKK